MPESKSRMPRLVIAAPHGRSGKTTVTIGLLAALVKRGFKVQPFKKGPDFIDPSWLSLVAGRSCRNLDLYFLKPEELVATFSSGCRGADLALIEGAMGLYDGLDLAGSGSTAEIAVTLRAPVVLVLDTTRMTRSAAALIQGFVNFDRRVHIAGVILNRVARPRHEDLLRRAISEYCGVPVLGAMPKSDSYVIPDRHLGLIPAGENAELHRAIAATGQAVEQHVDLAALLEVAAAAPDLALPSEKLRDAGSKKVQIGLIRDRAFSFYYPENIEALEQAGAEIVNIDSLRDTRLPDIHGLYIGGGFPEVFGRGLEANGVLRQQIKNAAARGLPVYAECGGLMYLARSLFYQGKKYDMVGALPLEVVVEKKPQGHGYTLLQVEGVNPFLPAGLEVRGHEFHHSRVVNLDRQAVSFAYRVLRGYGVDGARDGVVYRNIFASYNHLYAGAVPQWATNFVNRASEYRAGRRQISVALGM
ncbi:MAG: cobyrinic acid a,c-diamide synthase [Clostridia bacterium]|nr:cobyrinic acid a,c-diamide synthase [Clostridia bacterium]